MPRAARSLVTLVSLATLATVATVAPIALIATSDASPAPAAGAPLVEFSGNHDLSSNELRAAMVEPLSDPTAPFDQDALDTDLLHLSAYYWDRGYASVRVGAPSIDASRNAITIPIDEGPVFTMDQIDVTGELIGSARKHLAMLQIRPGLRFSRTMIAADLESLVTFYGDQGYAYANITPVTKVDLATRKIGLAFEIERGKRARYEHVTLFNSTKASDATIRGELMITPGAMYNATDLMAGKRRVAALEHVETVVVSTTRGTSDELIDITVEVAD